MMMMMMMMLMTVMMEEAEGKMVQMKLMPVRTGNTFYVASYVPGLILASWPVLTHEIFITTHFYPHFQLKKPRHREAKVSCPRPSSWKVVKPGLEPSLSGLVLEPCSQPAASPVTEGQGCPLSHLYCHPFRGSAPGLLPWSSAYVTKAPMTSLSCSLAHVCLRMCMHTQTHKHTQAHDAPDFNANEHIPHSRAVSLHTSPQSHTRCNYHCLSAEP